VNCVNIHSSGGGICLNWAQKCHPLHLCHLIALGPPGRGTLSIGSLEGTNNQIKTLQRQAFGFATPTSFA